MTCVRVRDLRTAVSVEGGMKILLDAGGRTVQKYIN